MIEYIKSTAPIIVHTGPEHLADLVYACLDNGIMWIGGRTNRMQESIDHYIERYGSSVSLSFGQHEGLLRFFFDNVDGVEIESILDLLDLSVAEYSDFEEVKKIDLSDFESLFE